MQNQGTQLEKILDQPGKETTANLSEKKQIIRDFPDNKRKLHRMLLSMEILVLSLLWLIYLVVCMLFGHGLYNLYQYQQCIFSLGIGLSGMLLYSAAQTLTLSTICCGIAGLSPFVTWFLLGKDSSYFELNVWLWLALMVGMLHGYVLFYREVYRRYWPERKQMIEVLAMQVRLVLYVIIVPCVACCGCFLLLGLNQGHGLFSPMDIIFFEKGLWGIKIMIWIYLAGIVMLLADTIFLYKDFICLSNFAKKK